MKFLKYFASYWIPPIAWMVLIFILSSRTRISVAETHIVNFIVFKSLHVIEYAILYFLLLRPFYKTDKNFFIPFLIAVLYAASDEFHQSFIPTREGTVRDIFIDTLGITLMYIYIRKFNGKNIWLN